MTFRLGHYDAERQLVWDSGELEVLEVDGVGQVRYRLPDPLPPVPVGGFEVLLVDCKVSITLGSHVVVLPVAPTD